MNCNIDTYIDTTEYLDHGHFNIKCTYCYARYNKHETKYTKYTKCCSNGKTVFPLLSKLPLYMNSLMCGNSHDSKIFMKKSQLINTNISFACLSYKDIYANSSGVRSKMYPKFSNFIASPLPAISFLCTIGILESNMLLIDC